MRFSTLTLAACALGVLGGSGSVALADAEAAKAPMYTYYSTWTLPRSKWSDFEKQGPGKATEHAYSAGTLVAYGGDETVVHTEDGQTHDGWFSAMSIAALLDTLNDLMQGGSTKTGVFDSATKHSDLLLVSHYYHWKSGSYKGAYTRSATYKLKESAPDDAVDTIAKSCMVPFLEKELAAGAIVEYEIDEQALHTENPSQFYLDWTTPTAEGQDKVLNDLDSWSKGTPLCGPAINGWLDGEAHRDLLVRGDATYR